VMDLKELRVIYHNKNPFKGLVYKRLRDILAQVDFEYEIYHRIEGDIEKLFAPWEVETVNKGLQYNLSIKDESVGLWVYGTNISHFRFLRQMEKFYKGFGLPLPQGVKDTLERLKAAIIEQREALCLTKQKRAEIRRRLPKKQRKNEEV